MSPLDEPQIDEAGAEHTGVIRCVVVGHHIDVNVGTVRCFEVCEANHGTAIGGAIDRRGAFGGMYNAVERSRFKGVRSRSVVRVRELFINVLIDTKSNSVYFLLLDIHHQNASGS